MIRRFQWNIVDGFPMHTFNIIAQFWKGMANRLITSNFKGFPLTLIGVLASSRSANLEQYVKQISKFVINEL